MNIEQVKELEELDNRLNLLEKHVVENSLTLLEILSNIAYFGDFKMKKCEFARDGQCGYFFLKLDATNKIPIATECKIKDCNKQSKHLHLVLSNISCAFCPQK